MEASVEALASGNGEEALGKAVPVLKKILGNLVKDAGNEKYRKLKTTNKVIDAKIMSVAGAVDVLEAVGFRRVGDELVVEGEDEAVRSASREAVALLDAKCAPATCGLCCVLAHTAAVRGVSLEGETVATACLDNVTRTWSARTGASLGSHSAHGKPARSDPGVLCVALRKQTTYSGARDGLLIKWQPGADPVRFMGHGEPMGDAPRPSNAQVVTCVAVGESSPDGNAPPIVVTAGWDRSAIVWDTEGDLPATRFGPFPQAVNSLSLVKEEDAELACAAACADGHLVFFQVAKKAVSPGDVLPGYRTLRDAVGAPLRASAACGATWAESTRLVTASNDGLLRLWSPTKLLKGARVASQDDFLFAVASTLTKCAVAGDDGVVTILALPDLATVQRLALPGPCWSLTMSDDFVVCGCDAEFGALVFAYDQNLRAPDFIRKNIEAISGDAARKAKLPVELLPGDKASFANAKQPRQGRASSSTGDVSMGQGYDFEFPVDLGTPDNLTIRWNHGDDPFQVATTFCLENRIPTGHVDEIVKFIQAAPSGGLVAQSSAVAPAVSGPQSGGPPSADVQADMIGQITALGVDPDRARDALGRTGWSSVEAAIALLFQ